VHANLDWLESYSRLRLWAGSRSSTRFMLCQHAAGARLC